MESPKKRCKVTGQSASIALLGVGNVGQAVIERILKARTIHADRYALRLNIAVVCDSTGMLKNEAFAPLSNEILESAVAWKKEGKKFREHSSGSPLNSLSDLSNLLNMDDIVVVDCTATEHTTGFLIKVLNAGGRVVLCNKKPLTGSQEEYDQLTHKKNVNRLGYESTVGAGTPMCTALRRLIYSGDKPKKIEGTLSGTLGYVMTGLGEGKSYSEVVNQAFKLGYTEPDPRDDLSGTDVGRKALIFARALGWKLEMKDVQIESLYPAEFQELEVNDFMSKLNTLDDSYHAKCNDARKKGEVLRYVATIEANKCVVGLKSLSVKSPIGSLTGTDNMAAFYTDVYAKPLVVQGSGAGGQVTAAGILADILQFLPFHKTARARMELS